jgi:hypothetical protein
MRIAWATTALLVLACAATKDELASVRARWEVRAYLRTDSMGVAPTQAVTVSLHAPRELTENSAAAMSVAQPGVLFTINDSGNDPVLFALDTTGADRGVWNVVGARNEDWESASVASCGSRDTRATAHWCVYIGDTGDNAARRSSRTIYRVEEPLANGTRGTVRAERLRFSYPDQPHDVEAMYVAPTGDIFLITKRPLSDAARHLRPALVFRLPASAWAARSVVAERVDSLPIVPGSAVLRLITDAALAPDGRHLAVRTYAQVYVFATDPVTGRVNHAVTPAVCNIASLGEPQGEGLTWVNNGGRFVFTSEGSHVPLHIANCPLPAR